MISLYDIIKYMKKRLRKDGSPDLRYKNPEPIKVVIDTPKELPEPTEEPQTEPQTDPQTLFNNLLESNNLEIDFDVLSGTIATKHGVIKLDKPTLVVRASYVTR